MIEASMQEDARDWSRFTACINKEIFSESCESKPNLDCNYPFSIDLATNGIPFVVKSIGKV